ncbi:Holliday junction resolvase RuvX [Salibacteraceae bacterium]|jgi:putative holliday junction resolvase|nr:Holliday junction resolvase RuvX [Salibacteraceae bacterium]MDB4104782.1 Holliday junction resolvase RuvX [Salibacteraceae bacterium]MDB9708832.1 Holliday junction resolvase RuvX [Salibacteraceae bacterium]MDC1305105.1 Holliday junction resolvase RuvX [Salibacteraceae bacterium]HAQ72112.1 Holliday junction resolvase RuvX [Flavobacteriales bacterium]
MGRVLALDYGGKRCGLAISDPLKMIANGLDTSETHLLLDNLKRIQKEYGFEKLVVGLPKRLSGEMSAIEQKIIPMIEKIKKDFPEVEIVRFDERFTSKMALESMIVAGAKKKQRAEKGNIDKVSATLLLQEYLNL